ncbi:hypothetical protein CHLRE_04g218650v5 [Chlamydomonas reinhardtii]|uniref:Uncoupling protein n=1 Tax=Chlamydomonas reinhardtii TaxID=3055 RepID=A0A2K3DU21_CHLRE|nr:uncharacterized protein CHLRE_04g218650v5 [Chlamydomonas reinhardtii]PNW84038.1 hypothetical protein CHLRE_04g218650v5 [Chlamydomonas reinhardtii]
MVAEGVTYPIDLLKTRLQLQGELAAASSSPKSSGPKPKGAVRLAAELIRREGMRGLYAGLAPALVRHIFYTGTRITVYEQLRRSYVGGLSSGTSGSGAGSSSSGSGSGNTSSTSTSTSTSSGNSVGLGAKLLMGLTAGAVGQAVAVPADLVKVRLQAEGRLVASGKIPAPRYKGMGDCLRQIVAQEGGMAGLWRGGGPAVQRAALVNLGELATYDQAKQLVLASGLTGGRDNLGTHTAASMCSGLFASVVSVPADVVKTRMMSQDPAAPKYRSSLDCLVRSVRAEGLLALYKGFLPTWARLGPWQLVFWTSYEGTRAAFNLGGF